MLSFGKIMLLLLVGVALFFGLRLLRTLQNRGPQPPMQKPEAPQAVADLIRCPHCTVFYDPREGHQCR